MTSTRSKPIWGAAQRQAPLFLLIAGGLAGAIFLKDVLDFQTLAENRERLLALRDAHYGWVAVGFVLAYATMVAFSLPGATIATLTGGFLFSTFPGVLFNVSGATIGAVLLFTAARWGLGDRLAQKMQTSEGRIKKIKEGIDANQWEMLFLIRLIPVVPFFVANLVPALVGVAFVPFLVTTFLGILPARSFTHPWAQGLARFSSGGKRRTLASFSRPLCCCLCSGWPRWQPCLRSCGRSVNLPRCET